MSRYGESATSYEKEDLFDHMKGFLEGYPLSDFMAILTDVIETIEWRKNKMSDLISRDDVYKVLGKVCICGMPVYVFDKLWNGISDLPSIKPEEDTKEVTKKFIHEILEADKRENTKKELDTRYNFLIDILDSNKFLTYGNLARMFDLKCDNEYDYYIGDKKLYRKWLSDIFEDCFNTISESESVNTVFTLDFLVLLLA